MRLLGSLLVLIFLVATTPALGVICVASTTAYFLGWWSVPLTLAYMALVLAPEDWMTNV